MTRKKKVYRPRSWSEYNKSLVGRGSLTLWVNEAVIADWYVRDKTGKKGASRRYADLAILCANQVRFLYHLPLRATQGFLTSLFALLKIECVIPCYTTLCRRWPCCMNAAKLLVGENYCYPSQVKNYIVIDFGSPMQANALRILHLIKTSCACILKFLENRCSENIFLNLNITVSANAR